MREFSVSLKEQLKLTFTFNSFIIYNKGNKFNVKSKCWMNNKWVQDVTVLKRIGMYSIRVTCTGWKIFIFGRHFCISHSHQDNKNANYLLWKIVFFTFPNTIKWNKNYASWKYAVLQFLIILLIFSLNVLLFLLYYTSVFTNSAHYF